MERRTVAIPTLTLPNTVRRSKPTLADTMKSLRQLRTSSNCAAGRNRGWRTAVRFTLAHEPIQE